MVVTDSDKSYDNCTLQTFTGSDPSWLLPSTAVRERGRVGMTPPSVSQYAPWPYAYRTKRSHHEHAHTALSSLI